MTTTAAIKIISTIFLLVERIMNGAKLAGTRPTGAGLNKHESLGAYV